MCFEMRTILLISLQMCASLYVHNLCNHQVSPNRQASQRVLRNKRILSAASFIIKDILLETVAIIFNNSTQGCALDFVHSMSSNRSVVLFTETDLRSNMHQFVLKIAREKMVDDMRKHLNFVMFCSLPCIKRSLKIGQNIDSGGGNNSTLRHFSRWIIVPTDAELCVFPPTSTMFDNVVLLSTQGTRELEVHTLMWRNTSREWVRTDVQETVSVNTEHIVFPNQRLGLNGRRLKAGALEWAPFLVKTTNRSETCYTGIGGHLMDYLSKKLNFTYVYVEPADQEWGRAQENGSWTGLVGLLQREDVDLSSAPYAFSPERTRVMEFSYPILLSHVAAIYREPGELMESLPLLSCFKWQVYIVGAAVFLGSLSVSALLDRFTYGKDKHFRKDTSIVDKPLSMVAVVLGQGTYNPPLFCSGRVFFSFWCMFTIIIMGAYRGNLVAFQTVDKPVTPFRTVEDLANQDQYEIGTRRGNFISLTLQNSNLPLYRKLWEKVEATDKKSPSGYASNNAYLLRRLDEGRFVLLESSEAGDLILSEGCNLRKLQEEFMFSRSSIVFPKGSPLAKLFYREILLTVEAGVYEKWYKSQLQRHVSCDKSLSGIRTRQLRIQTYYNALVACAVGIVFSLLILLVELQLKTRSYDCKT